MRPPSPSSSKPSPQMDIKLIDHQQRQPAQHQVGKQRQLLEAVDEEQRTPPPPAPAPDHHHQPLRQRRVERHQQEGSRYRRSADRWRSGRIPCTSVWPALPPCCGRGSRPKKQHQAAAIEAVTDQRLRALRPALVQQQHQSQNPNTSPRPWLRRLASSSRGE